MFDDEKNYSLYSRPLPELLDGDDWEARNSGDLKKAYVDFTKKEFVVPFVAGPSGELVRAHEAMHVKITPRKNNFSEADFVTYQAIEDARVNQGLRLAGIQTDIGRVYSDREIEGAFSGPENKIPIRLGEAYFATAGIAEQNKVREIIEEIRPEVMPICDEIYEKYYASNERNGDLTSVEESHEALKELKKLMQELNTEQEQDYQDASTADRYVKGARNITQQWIPGGSDWEEEEELPVMTAEEMEESKNLLDKRYEGRQDGGEPGTMSISKARLDKSINFKKVKSIKVTASDEGVIPSRMYRYATDQRIFSAKGRRRANAAVLIDDSGSMSLSQEEIIEIIRLCPAAIVAVYSGGGTKGELRIVAEKGRFSDDFQGRDSGRGNIVDFPAIEWLARQKEKKKLWISDGIVTGKNDRLLDSYYIRKMVAICARHKIERVGDVRTLIKEGKLIDSAFDDGYEIGNRKKARVGRV